MIGVFRRVEQIHAGDVMITRFSGRDPLPGWMPIAEGTYFKIAETHLERLPDEIRDDTFEIRCVCGESALLLTRGEALIGAVIFPCCRTEFQGDTRIGNKHD